MSHIRNFWSSSTSTIRDARNECCGCGGCANACGLGAIQMLYDEEGFLYPKLDEAKCIGCGACLRCCPIENVSDESVPFDRVYGGYSSSEQTIMGCASGGFATELSYVFVKSGGVVYGVVYNDDYTSCEYSRASEEEELIRFMSSKYTQSVKRDIFKRIKDDLTQGKKVLFIGCPCDAAAVRLFCGEKQDLLYICELVCMGVTSFKVAEQYKLYVEKKNGSKLISINSRSKKKGWYVPYIEEVYENGKVRLAPLYGTYYGHAFLTYVRPSCLDCKFRAEIGTSDFRIGDFWGVKPTDNHWNEKGVSVVFVRGERGEEIIEKMKEAGFVFYEKGYEEATKNNRSALENKPAFLKEKREKFAHLFLKKGLIKACRKTVTMKFWVKKFVPTKMANFLKKMYHKIKDK